eukprot:TRINITY_DN14880_c0_g1_i1.p1 TRINITY_DN14880_c0_g1~~TRINITY_DN14880_c0_g1_i1.p1  ORF type:complete len:912 (+),score=184.61 TRINITY_DN14880_c0_g1_i1:88-2823(+)
MPFRASVEILVTFLKFRNIDLLEQGLYFIAVSARPDTAGPGRDASGAPCPPRLLRHGTPVRCQHGIPAFAARVDGERVTTHAVMVRYLDQTEDMDEAALLSVILTFELWHMGLAEVEKAGAADVPWSAYRQVAAREIPLRNAMLSHTQYLPLTWPGWWSACCTVLLHTSLVSIKDAFDAALSGRRPSAAAPRGTASSGRQSPQSPQSPSGSGDFAAEIRKDKLRASEKLRNATARMFGVYASYLAYAYTLCAAHLPPAMPGGWEGSVLAAVLDGGTAALRAAAAAAVATVAVLAAGPPAASGREAARPVHADPAVGSPLGPAQAPGGAGSWAALVELGSQRELFTASQRAETLLQAGALPTAAPRQHEEPCPLALDRRCPTGGGLPAAPWLGLCLSGGGGFDAADRAACARAARAAQHASAALVSRLHGAICAGDDEGSDDSITEAVWAPAFRGLLELASQDAAAAWSALIDTRLLRDTATLLRTARARWWRDEHLRARAAVCEAWHDRLPVRPTDSSPAHGGRGGPSPPCSPSSTDLPSPRASPQAMVLCPPQTPDSPRNAASASAASRTPQDPTSPRQPVPPYLPLTFTYPNCTYCEYQLLQPPADSTAGAAPATPAPAEALDCATGWSDDEDPSRGIHLVVLVHGYGGSKWDLAALRNHFLLAMPRRAPHFHCAVSLDKRTDESITVLGNALAAEVLGLLREHPVGHVTRLSFIGHSMGNLVIRAALQDPAAQPLLPLLWTYASLSGPHVGVADTDCARVSGGLWVLVKLRKVASISQLRLDDDTLQRLAAADEIGRFRHVFFLASEDDRYVSMQSATLDTATSALIAQQGRAGHQKAAMVDLMLHHLSQKLKACRCVHKFNLRFRPVGRTRLSSMQDAAVGKAVHIAFLSNPDFVHSFVCLFRLYFD